MKTIEEFELLFYKAVESARTNEPVSIGFNVNKVPSRRRDEVWKYLFDHGYKIEPDDDTLTYIFISW